MPHLVQMDKRYKKKGLVLIAPECQGTSKEEVLKLLKKNGVDYTVTSGVQGPNLSNGIPHAMVFDITGKLIFHGHPSDDNFERSVKTALKDVKEEADEDNATTVTGPIIASRTWTNAEGKKIMAAVREISEKSVKFQMSNGRVVDYDIAKLSDEDQEVLKKAGEEKTDEDEEESE